MAVRSTDVAVRVERTMLRAATVGFDPKADIPTLILLVSPKRANVWGLQPGGICIS
jgi:hypothetical protein